MSQPIERILVRHLGSRLAVPLFLVDVDGTLVFYNEAAEQLLGRRFDDAGEMSFEEWTSVFAVRDEAGQPLAIDELPLVKALRQRRPAYARFDIIGLDGAPRPLEVAAFPLQGQGGSRLGAVALFWEAASP
jgi:PAS domain-containing protein